MVGLIVRLELDASQTAPQIDSSNSLSSRQKNHFWKYFKEKMDFRINFRWQYQAAQKLLSEPRKFSPEWQKIVLGLQRLMTPTGFDPAAAGYLEMAREKILSTNQALESNDPAIIIINAALGVSSQNGILAMDSKLRASALKFLQHIYLLSYSGEHCYWVHSLPKEFGNWSVLTLKDEAPTLAHAAQYLRSNTEHFLANERHNLGAASMHALNWVQRTGMVLAVAQSKTAKLEEIVASRDLVKRWFADDTTTEGDLDKCIGILTTGFKSIAATLTKGRLIFTDFVPLRRASTDKEIRYLNSEAFVFANKGEGMDVIYIEQSFFYPRSTGVLAGPKNWVRIIVHEISHLDCNTIDVPDGKYGRYAWAGIGPHAGFPARDAIRNADNWAYFCADCAQVLSAGERMSALRKT